jgi:probable HAF family extracellular repeat protein
MKSHLVLSWLLLAPSLVLASPAAASPAYTVTNLGGLGTQYGTTVAYGLNDAGVAVGYSIPDTGFFQGFRWVTGTISNLGHLANPANPFTSNFSIAEAVNLAGQAVGWSTFTVNGLDYQHAVQWDGALVRDLGAPAPFLSSAATAINRAGAVVGTLTKAAGGASGDRGFLWQAGSMTTIGTLGGRNSAAFGINDTGQVVGNATTGDGAVHAFVWRDGAITDLGALANGTFSVAVAVNQPGDIVGVSTLVPATFSSRHAFRYHAGQMVDLGVPPPTARQTFVESFADDINDDGVIVGSAGGRAFLYRDGAWTDLNTLIPANSGWVLTTAVAINNAGQIVGTGTVNGGTRYQGFLLTPLAP